MLYTYIPMGMQTYETATMNIGHGCMSAHALSLIYKCMHTWLLSFQVDELSIPFHYNDTLHYLCAFYKIYNYM